MNPDIPTLTTLMDARCPDFPLVPFQRRWLRLATKPDVRVVALSVARGNAKTHLAARVVAEALAGTLGVVGEVFLVASSYQQARIGFKDITTLLEPELARDRLLPPREREWRVVSNQSLTQIDHRDVSLRCLGADPRRLHGLRPALVVADEPAQWGPSGEAQWQALLTALGKVSQGRILAVGTRPESRHHWFERVLISQQPTIQSLVYSATDTDPPFTWQTIGRANPGLRFGFPAREVLDAERGEAKRDPAAFQAWKALRLNLGVADVLDGERLIPADVWMEATSHPTLPPAEGEAVWGVDLGGSRSLSSVVAYWPVSGRVECLTACGGEPGVVERGRLDGVGSLYAEAVRDGTLLVSDNRVPDVESLLRECLARWGAPRVAVADRWRQAELMDAISRVGWGVPVDWRGAGVKDGGTDVAIFRKATLTGRVVAEQNRLLDHAVGVARCRVAVTGDRVLAPGNKRGARDDPAAALVLAVSGGERLLGNRPQGVQTGFAVGRG